MGLLLTAYVFMSLVFAVTGGWKSGAAVGFYTLATAALFMLSGGRLKQIVQARLVRSRTSRGHGELVIAGVILAIAAAGLAQWLSSGFSVQIAGYGFAGWIWGWLGFVIALLVF